MPAVQETIDAVAEIDVDKYKYGFATDIESEKAPKGLNEDVIRFISAKKEEPEWMLKWRLEAFERWKQMEEPSWARVNYPKIDFQDIYYYAAPKNFEDGPKSLDEVDPELLRTYEKLGIPLKEQEILAGVRKPGDPSPSDEDGSDNVYASGRVAVDAVFDSVSVVTTFKEELAKGGGYLLFDIRGHQGTSGAYSKISGFRGSGDRQLLRNAQLCGVYGWFIRLCA